MSEFKIIETQEQFDAAIAPRLQRERETFAKRYEEEIRNKGWISPEDLQKITDSNAQKIKALEEAAEATKQLIADKDAEIAKGEQYRTDLEKTRIALEAGLRIDYADRLRGENAEEWKADAAALAKDFAAAHYTPPLPSGEPAGSGKASAREKFAEWANETLNT